VKNIKRGFGVPTLISGSIFGKNDPNGLGLDQAKLTQLQTGGHKAGVLKSIVRCRSKIRFNG